MYNSILCEFVLEVRFESKIHIDLKLVSYVVLGLGC